MLEWEHLIAMSCTEILPKVSVVITCFNNAEYIVDAILSVKAQTYPNIEIVVVDDSSTDNSVDILRRFRDDIVLVLNRENKGVSAARNVGYLKASGDFLTQLDGDDIFAFNKIENEINVAKSHPHSIISSFHSIIDERGRLVKKYTKESGAVRRLGNAAMKYRVGYFGRDWLIPKECLNGLMYDEDRNLYEDWQFKLKLMEKHPVYLIDYEGTRYRQLRLGLSSRNRSQHLESQLNIFFDLYESKLERLLFCLSVKTKLGNKILRLLYLILVEIKHALHSFRSA